MIILGVLLVINPVGVMFWICEIIGFLLLTVGLWLIVMYFVSGREEGGARSAAGVTFGVILLAIGIYIVIDPTAILQFVTILIAMILFMHGIYDFTEARVLKAYEHPHWYVPIISAIVKFLLGILIILKPVSTGGIITVIAGIALILAGISGIYLRIKIGKAMKTLESQIDEAAAYAQTYNAEFGNDSSNIVDGELISEETISDDK